MATTDAAISVMSSEEPFKQALPRERSLEHGFRQAKPRRLAVCEVHDRYDRRENLPRGCRERSPDDAPAKHADEHVVEHDVDQAARHDDDQSDVRLLGCHEKALEDVLEDEERQREKEDLPVLDGEVDELSHPLP